MLPADAVLGELEASVRRGTSVLAEAAVIGLGDAVHDTDLLAQGRLSTYGFLERGARRLAPPAPNRPPPMPPPIAPPLSPLLESVLADIPGADDGRVGGWRRMDVIILSFVGVFVVFLCACGMRLARKRYRRLRRLRRHAKAGKLGSGETSDEEEEEERDLLRKPGRKRAEGVVSSGGVVVGDGEDDEDLSKLEAAPPADVDSTLTAPVEPPRSLLRWDAEANAWITLDPAAGEVLGAGADVETALAKATASDARASQLDAIEESDESASRMTTPAAPPKAVTKRALGDKARKMRKKKSSDPARADARRRLADPDSWFKSMEESAAQTATLYRSPLDANREAAEEAPPVPPQPLPAPRLPPSGVGGSRPRPLAPYLRQSAAYAARPDPEAEAVELDELLPAMQGFGGGEGDGAQPPALEAFPARGGADAREEALGRWRIGDDDGSADTDPLATAEPDASAAAPPFPWMQPPPGGEAPAPASEERSRTEEAEP